MSSKAAANSFEKLPYPYIDDIFVVVDAHCTNHRSLMKKQSHLRKGPKINLKHCNNKTHKQ